MNKSGRANHVAREINNYTIAVLGLREISWLQTRQLILSFGIQLGHKEDATY